MKFGVVIGDSIAEGHPMYHGRLHTISGDVDLSKENEEGQISFYFEKYSGVKVYNNGIGSQTTLQIMNRWERDALGMASLELDPSATLPGKPEFIVLCVGINDIWQDVSAADIIKNLEYFINTAKRSNIPLIIFNIGPQLYMDEEKLARIKEINGWLKDVADTEAIKDKAVKDKAVNKTSSAALNTNIAVFDFFGFANDPDCDGKPKHGMFCDDVHPTGATYLKIADIIYEKCIAPLTI